MKRVLTVFLLFCFVLTGSALASKIDVQAENQFNLKKMPLPTEQQASVSGAKEIVVIYDEDFENNAEGWTTDSGYSNEADAEGNLLGPVPSNWMLTEDKSNSPTHSMWIDDDIDVYRDFLISPPIQIPADVNGDPVVSANVSFYMNIDNPGFGELDSNYLADYFYLYMGMEETLFKVADAGATGAASYSSVVGENDYPANSNQYLTSPEIDLSAASDATTLSFNYSLLTEEAWDFARVDVSTDDFVTYTTLASYGNNTADWTAVSLDLGAFAGQVVKVRFTFLADAGTAVPNGGLMVDDISVDDGATNIFFDGAEEGAQTMVPFGITFYQMYYEYDRIGDAGAEWHYRDELSPFNGSADLFDFGAMAGDEIYIAFRYRTDGTSDQGEPESSGLYIDDVAITAISGLEKDAAVDNIVVGYPMTVGQTTPLAATIANKGFAAQSVSVWYDFNMMGKQPVPPRIELAAFADSTVVFPVMMNVPMGTDTADVEVSVDLSGEMKPEDNMMNADVNLDPIGFATLGYDDPTSARWVWSYDMFDIFDPLGDIKGTDTYNLDSIDIFFYTTALDTAYVTVVALDPADPFNEEAQMVIDEFVVPVGGTGWYNLDLTWNAMAMGLDVPVGVIVDVNSGNGSVGVITDDGTPFPVMGFVNVDGEWYQHISGGVPYGQKVNANISWFDKPHNVTVMDVPADQGGKVLVNWGASANQDVEKYAVWHKVDPELFPMGSANVINFPTKEAFYVYGNKAKAGDVAVIGQAKGVAPWVAVGTVPVHGDMMHFSIIADTWKDSTVVNGMYMNEYMVTAYDMYGNFVDSEVAAGYSVDNIKPMPPMGLAAKETEEGVMVTWAASVDADFDHFTIYRDGEELAMLNDLFYMDNDVEIGNDYKYSVKAFDASGNASEGSEVALKVTAVESVELPKEFALYNNYPNPFNPTTSIKVALPTASELTLTIFNSNGQVVETLFSGHKEAGYYNMSWNGVSSSAGVYFLQMHAGDYSNTIKMTLLK